MCRKQICNMMQIYNKLHTLRVHFLKPKETNSYIVYSMYTHPWCMLKCIYIYRIQHIIHSTRPKVWANSFKIVNEINSMKERKTMVKTNYYYKRKASENMYEHKFYVSTADLKVRNIFNNIVHSYDITKHLIDMSYK